MSNPFFTLQDRLASLLKGSAYFAGWADGTIVTEKIGDLDTKVATDLLPLGYGSIITTAKGDATSSLTVIRSKERLTVTFFHNPTLQPDRNVLDMLFAGVRAINGVAIIAGKDVRTPEDVWRVVGHERRLDVPPELHVHQLHVEATLNL